MPAIAGYDVVSKIADLGLAPEDELAAELFDGMGRPASAEARACTAAARALAFLRCFLGITPAMAAGCCKSGMLAGTETSLPAWKTS